MLLSSTYYTLALIEFFDILPIAYMDGWNDYFTPASLSKMIEPKRNLN